MTDHYHLVHSSQQSGSQPIQDSGIICSEKCVYVINKNTCCVGIWGRPLPGLATWLIFGVSPIIYIYISVLIDLNSPRYWSNSYPHRSAIDFSWMICAVVFSLLAVQWLTSIYRLPVMQCWYLLVANHTSRQSFEKESCWISRATKITTRAGSCNCKVHKADSQKVSRKKYQHWIQNTQILIVFNRRLVETWWLLRSVTFEGTVGSWRVGLQETRLGFGPWHDQKNAMAFDYDL